MKRGRVRVEAKRLSSNASTAERIKNVVILQRLFKKMCDYYGIGKAMKDRQFFVRRTDINRRKKMRKRLGAQQPAPVERNQEEYYS